MHFVLLMVQSVSYKSVFKRLQKAITKKSANFHGASLYMNPSLLLRSIQDSFRGSVACWVLLALAVPVVFGCTCCGS